MAGERPPDADAVWAEAFGGNGVPADDLDALSRVALLEDGNGQVAAAGRMYYADGAYWLDGIAVRAAYRAQGYGDLLTRMMLDMAITHGARMIRINTPGDCVSFFKRYGFRAAGEVEGVATMELRAEDVRLTCSAS